MYYIKIFEQIKLLKTFQKFSIKFKKKIFPNTNEVPMPRGYFDSKRREDCVKRCKWPVGVEATVKPDVSCRPLCKKDAEFDIEVDFTVKPNCCPKLKAVHKDECGCVTKCVWTVKVDLECDAHVRCMPCNKPSAEFLVLADIETIPKCYPIDCPKPKKDCDDSHDSKSDSDSDDDCDCHDCKRGRKY